MKLRALATAAWTALCVLVAHQAAYVLAFGDAHARQHALEGSGHSWYGMLLPALALGAVVATIAALAEGRRAKMSAPSLYLPAAVLFLSLEFVERFAHLGSLDAVVHNVASVRGALPIVLGIVLLGLLVPIARWARRTLAALTTRHVVPPVRARFAAVWEDLVAPSRPGTSTAPRGPPVAGTCKR